MHPNKNVNNLIMNILPDNRPITSLQIVEDYYKCPKNFTSVHRTHDQDADADLWRENNLFGKKTGRYLCLSKTEGLPEYIVETLKVIAERELPPEGFSLLSRTADTEQKAWRKRQIAYKLSKRGSVNQAVTDIILCSKLKQAPQGFQLAGEINGVAVCFKLGQVTHRAPPTVPPTAAAAKNGLLTDIQNSMHYINISPKPLYPLPSEQSKNATHHDYEEIRTSYQLASPTTTIPIRTAPRPPQPTIVQHNTLGTHSDIDGVPFMMNPNLQKINQFELTPLMNLFNSVDVTSKLAYDFQLERQVLCTTKSIVANAAIASSINSKNPFFQ